MEKKRLEKIFNIIILIVYCIITFIVMIRHEPWRDEAQAWLIARDLPLIDIFKQMQYEGHPCLWHLILLPFAKLNFPYITLNLISWIIMVISAILIIFKSPFKKVTKIFILLSAPFIYFYVCISRVYTLIGLLVIILASIYKDKEKHPCLYGILLALLANTHILMAGMVGTIFLTFYLKEIINKIKNKEINKNKKLIIGALIVILGFILLFIQLMLSLTSNKEIGIFQLRFLTVKIQRFIQIITNTFFLNIMNNENYTFTLFIFAIIAFQIFTIKEHFNQIVIFVGTTIFQCFVYLFVYKYTLQGFLLIYFVIIFCCWTQKFEKKYKYNISSILEYILLIVSIITIINNYVIVAGDLFINYSGSKEIAEYINYNLEEDSIIIATTDSSASSIIPYINIKFWSPQTEKYFTYITWNEERKKDINYEQLKNKLIKYFENNKKIYLLYSEKSNMNEIIEKMQDNNEIKMIYKNDDIILQNDEKFQLFKIMFL